jgi:cold shock CspA family protein
MPIRAGPSICLMLRLCSVALEARSLGRVANSPASRFARSAWRSRESPRPRASRSQVIGEVVESIGTVKVYKSDKGFGFVCQDGGGKDVFVHATALARAGLSGLVEGQRVRMQIGQGQKGLEAQTIELLD